MSITSRLPEDVFTRLNARGGYLLASDASELGVSRRDVARWLSAGRIERVLRGVYALPLENGTREDVYRRRVRAALVSRRGSPPVLAGPAAVVWHGLPLLGAPPPVVHIAAPRTRGRKRGEVFEPIGPLAPSSVVRVGREMVSEVGRAALDTARFMAVTSGVAAIDAALRLGATNLDLLAVACAELSGAAGVERARRATRLASPASESPGESWSIVRIDDAGLPEPQRQHSFYDEYGFIGRTDFWWPEQGVVGEFDGRIKYARENPARRPPEEVLWEEKQREDRLRATGLRVIRWTTKDLVHPTPWLARLTTLLNS